MPVLKIGVVMDPIEKINIDKDTTFVLLLEAEQRNHEVYYMELDDLFIRGGIPYGRSRRVHVARRIPHYRLGEFKTGALEDFDVVLMRKDPPFDMKFFFSTHLLSLVNEQKCFVMNHPKGLREANEKLYALRFPEQIPQTLVTSDMRRLKEFMVELGGEMIIKPLDGAGGSGVFYLNQQDRNTNSILEAATNNGQKLVMGQRYLPEIRQGDKRIIVLNGEPLGRRNSRQYSRRRTVCSGGGHAARPRNLRSACTVAAARWVIFRRPGRDRKLSHRSQRHQPHGYSGN
jgi:glutathione synthase